MPGYKTCFSKLATSDPHSYAGDPGAALGSPATTKEVRDRTQAQATSFAVAGNPKAAPGSPAYVCGSEVANLANFYVVDSARAARLQTSAQLPGY